jgi:hypothetical protein
MSRHGSPVANGLGVLEGEVAQLGSNWDQRGKAGPERTIAPHKSFVSNATLARGTNEGTRLARFLEASRATERVGTSRAEVEPTLGGSKMARFARFDMVLALGSVVMGAFAACSGKSDGGGAGPTTTTTTGTGGTAGQTGSGGSGGTASGGTGGTAGGGGTGGSPCNETASGTALESVKAANAPSIDGKADDWGCLPSFEKELNANIVYTPQGSPKEPSYPGLTTTKVSIKSVYTATDVYFLAQWKDPTRSLVRLPWEKQSDGKWTQLANKDSSKHENTYYEDKFALQWNINQPEFATQGCMANCHLISDKANANYPGKKYNNAPGQLTDLWHWKSVRTEPNGQLDDGNVVYQDPSGMSLNGRVPDALTAGGYKDNNYAGYGASCAGDPTGALGVPCFMGPNGSETAINGTYHIFDSQKQTFLDKFVKGDRIAGIITSAFVGSRGDVATKASYDTGTTTWTLEMKRSLVTAAGVAEDVQFDDLKKTYHFGVAVFDNTQINHAVHAGVVAFTFRP